MIVIDPDRLLVVTRRQLDRFLLKLAVLIGIERGAGFGDLNNDGKIDIVVTVLNGEPQLLMNRTQNHNHWIILKLIGVVDNRDGLGTRVKITTANGVQYNEATTAVGYNSSSDKRVYFGLRNATVVDQIELLWPTGVKQVLHQVMADQILTIVQSSSSKKSARPH